MEGGGSARVLGVVLAGGRSERMGECKALMPWPARLPHSASQGRTGAADGPSTGPSTGASAGAAAGAAAEAASGAASGADGGRGGGAVPMVLLAARALGSVAVQCCVAPGGQVAVADLARAAGLDVLADAGTPRADEASVGPLGALTAGLEAARGRGLDGVLALACDMPRVGRGELVPLVDALAGGADAAMWCVDGRDQPLCAAYGLACLEPARRALGRGERRVVALLDPPATGGRGPVVARLVPDAKSALRLLNVNTPADYDLGRRGLA